MKGYSTAKKGWRTQPFSRFFKYFFLAWQISNRVIDSGNDFINIVFSAN